MKHKTYKSMEELGRAWNVPNSEIRKNRIQVDLIVAIHKKMKSEGLTHLEAAKKTGVGRTVITSVMNGNFLSMSTDRLIQIAEGLGLKVTMKVA